MIKNYTYVIALFIGILVTSCGNGDLADAYGNFESTSITVSAKGSGELLALAIEEGQTITANERVGLIDTTQLHLEKLQLEAQIAALDLKLQEAAPDIAILLEDKQNLTRERDRTMRLVEQKAATQQQLDDYNGQIEVIDQRINSTRRTIGIANRGVLAERKPMEAQIALVEKQLRDCHIINPITGTVLTKFSEPNELMSVGSPLYRVANLDEMKLRAYTSATLLQDVKLNDEVTVRIDEGEKGFKEIPGTITWIANEAEFTPKTIQTKEERVNLVYALEVTVKNDGTIKIGMPGEVLFTNGGTQ